jgi:hypothetical protein
MFDKKKRKSEKIFASLFFRSLHWSFSLFFAVLKGAENEGKMSRISHVMTYDGA